MNTKTELTGADFNVTDRRPTLTYREGDEGRTHTVFADGIEIGKLRKIDEEMWRLVSTSEHRPTREAAAELLLTVYCAARDALRVPLINVGVMFEQGYEQLERAIRQALEQGTLDRADVLDLLSATRGMLLAVSDDGHLKRARDLFDRFTREARARVDEPDDLILTLGEGGESR
jgi:exonuclease VII small subunit